MNWYLMVWKKYAQFSGRSRRNEYWMFTLFNLLIYVLLYGAAIALMESGIGKALLGICAIYGLAILIPSLAVGVRRLHDTGRSGWWLLICFVPIVGGLILLVFFVLDSEPGTNQYGPNPKAA
ncbi:MAG TPA: DUF805 domain-containing protein [Terracidiphilus sp.]